MRSERERSAAGGRLAWLDALRGLAALAVVYVHFAEYALSGPARAFAGWLNFGHYGVVLFFLISGYVIPLSLERRGSLRRFWVGRVFRLYPAYLLAAAAMGLLVIAGVRAAPGMLVSAPGTGLAAHATMLTGLVGISGLVGVFWTLSYEMVFYLTAAALFTLRLHRHSGWLAVALAGVAVAGGSALPARMFAATAAHRAVTAAVLLALVAATVAGYVSGRRRLSVGCAVAGLSVLALPVLNGGATAGPRTWQAVTFLAVMFAGTTVYRLRHGQVGPRAGAAALLAVLAGAVAAAWLHGFGPVQARSWSVTVLAVAATFGLALLARHARLPRPLLWLGQVSYSVYLLHQILLHLTRHLAPEVGQRALPVQLAVAAAYLAVVLVVAGAAYRWVERPAQRLGHRVAAALDRRWGPDHAVPRQRPVPTTVAPATVAPATEAVVP